MVGRVAGMNTAQTKRKGVRSERNVERVGNYSFAIRKCLELKIAMKKMEIRKGRDEQWQNALLS
jgi:hypothetical protein